MAVKTGLGSAVASALPVVDVEVEWELGHLSVKLDESGRVIVHMVQKMEKGIWSEGEREVCRWGWDGMRRNEGDEPTVL
jgi:hypothetical protein